MQQGITLREVRLALGLNPLQVAALASCPVETVVHAEFGTLVPVDEAVRGRLAKVYGLTVAEFLELAFDAAERWASRQSG
jgi:transcriptional regulator with XRE-family HTH domain